MGSVSKFIRSQTDAPSQSSLDNVRRLSGEAADAPAGRTGRDAVKRGMAQSPNTSVDDADKALPLGLARELIRTPEGRMQLQSMFSDLSPKAQQNFLVSIAAQTRDSRSPAKGFQLTPEGSAIHDIVMGGEPSPQTAEYLKRYRYQVDSDPIGHTELSEVPEDMDASERAAPHRPKATRPDGGELSTPSNKPAFRAPSKTTLQPDGSFREVYDPDAVHYDRATARAIEKAKKGEAVSPVSDRQAMQGASIPEQNFTNRLYRLGELVDPHSGIPMRSQIGDEGLAPVETPQSAFAPGGNRGVAGPAIATVRPADYGDFMEAARQLGINNPNEYANAEEFARALVSKANQEGFNVSPITASQRADATETVRDLMYDPQGAEVTTGRQFGRDFIPSGRPSEAAIGQEVRKYHDDATRAMHHANRAFVQEQFIDTLARKAEKVFGHLGWGENYRSGAGAAGVDGPSTATGMRAGTTQDPLNVPHFEGTTINQRVEAPPMQSKPLPGKPGMEVAPDVEMDDLVDLDERRKFATGDENAAGTAVPEDQAGGAESGRAHGDKNPTNYSPEREEGGHKPGAYDDYSDFAPHNDGRNATPKDLKKREQFYENAEGTTAGGQTYPLRDAVPMSTERTSELRQQMRELIDANPQPGPEVVAQIAKLQRRLKLSQQLDAMSGIKSSRVAPEAAAAPEAPKPQPAADSAPAANTDPNLEASATAVDEPAATNPWASNRYDLNGKPVDETPNKVDESTKPKEAAEPPKGEDPAKPKKADEPDPKDPKSKKWLTKKNAVRAAKIGVGGLGFLGGWAALHSAGQPKAQPFPDGGEGGGGSDGNSMYDANGNIAPATSESRIRALQQFLNHAQYNQSQIPSNYIQ